MKPSVPHHALMRIYPSRVPRRCTRCGARAYCHSHGVCLECEPPAELPLPKQQPQPQHPPTFYLPTQAEIKAACAELRAAREQGRPVIKRRYTRKKANR